MLDEFKACFDAVKVDERGGLPINNLINACRAINIPCLSIDRFYDSVAQVNFKQLTSKD